MIIVCPTVPHTGTHFMRKLLDSRASFDEVVIVHPYPDQLPELERLIDGGNPVIIPVRALNTVMTSWKKYGKDLANFAGWSLLKWLQVQDGLVLRAMQNSKLFHLNLDQPMAREAQLAEINRELGLDLKTDWEPVRQAGA